MKELFIIPLGIALFLLAIKLTEYRKDRRDFKEFKRRIGQA